MKMAYRWLPALLLGLSWSLQVSAASFDELYSSAVQAVQSGDLDAAKRSLDEYLTTAPSTDPHYIDALKLAQQVQRDLAAKAQQAQVDRAAAEAKSKLEQRLAAARANRAGLAAQIKSQMVKIPKGRFKMGDPVSSLRGGAGYPVHEVRVRAFRLGKYEVTMEQYDVFAVAADRPLPSDSGFGAGKVPVINVTHEDILGFINWLNVETRREYRLPTEAEWEYAARAGSEPYPPPQEPVNKPVGSEPPNLFGLHDMVGSVGELVADCWHDDYRGAPADGSAWITDCRDRFVTRGWPGAYVYVRYRGDYRVGHKQAGFRLAMDD